jgi:hypothetical protein
MFFTTYSFFENEHLEAIQHLEAENSYMQGIVFLGYEAQLDNTDDPKYAVCGIVKNKHLYPSEHRRRPI